MKTKIINSVCNSLSKVLSSFFLSMQGIVPVMVVGVNFWEGDCKLSLGATSAVLTLLWVNNVFHCNYHTVVYKLSK